mmetsp:Transcript_32470/g.49678  ORF Transcript_32470/g.49678 Transcript_32470/m.49678 type:complete len:453 (+) Transcript_32470:350-1708(+)
MTTLNSRMMAITLLLLFLGDFHRAVSYVSAFVPKSQHHLYSRYDFSRRTQFMGPIHNPTTSFAHKGRGEKQKKRRRLMSTLASVVRRRNRRIDGFRSNDIPDIERNPEIHMHLMEVETDEAVETKPRRKRRRRNSRDEDQTAPSTTSEDVNVPDFIDSSLADFMETANPTERIGLSAVESIVSAKSVIEIPRMDTEGDIGVTDIDTELFGLSHSASVLDEQDENTPNITSVEEEKRTEKQNFHFFDIFTGRSRKSHQKQKQVPGTDLKNTKSKESSPKLSSKEKSSTSPKSQASSNGFLESFLRNKIKDWSKQPARNLTVRASPRGNLLSKAITDGKLNTDVSVEFDRIFLKPVQISGGGEIRVNDISFNVWSLAGVRRRFASRFEFQAHNCSLLQEDLLKSSCITKGLRTLLLRVLKRGNIHLEAVKINTVRILVSLVFAFRGYELTVVSQ